MGSVVIGVPTGLLIASSPPLLRPKKHLVKHKVCAAYNELAESASAFVAAIYAFTSRMKDMVEVVCLNKGASCSFLCV